MRGMARRLAYWLRLPLAMAVVFASWWVEVLGEWLVKTGRWMARLAYRIEGDPP